MFLSRLFSLICLFFFCFCIQTEISAAESVSSYRSVIKVRSYTYDPFTSTYSTYAEGSAVIVGQKKVITNAHVILDPNDAPTGFYELCLTNDFISLPRCFVTAKLISFDTEADIALLEPDVPLSSSLIASFSEEKIDLASSVNIYGYPAIGGKTITSTSGKIAGFENGIYKLDATIDHGNSGGGAFDNSGKLLGMPFAIRSDNGVIGYMIPESTIQKFLEGKTPDFEKFYQNQADFVRYIGLQKKMVFGKNIITDSLVLKNPKSYGFHIVDGEISGDKKIFSYSLQSVDTRVTVGYSCDQIYGDQTLADVQEYSLTHSPENDTPDVITRTSYLGKNNSHLLIQMQSTDQTKKGDFSYIYPRSYSNCFASIASTSRYTDEKNIENAKKMIVDGTLWKDFGRKMTFSEPLLSNQKITLSNAFRIHKMLDSFGGMSFVLWYNQVNKNISGGDLHLTNYQNIKDMFYHFDPNYSGKDFSFVAFTKVYSQQNDANMHDEVLTSSSGQKFLFSVSDNGDTKDISFDYLFRTTQGQYIILSLTNFTLTGATDQDILNIKNFFSSFDFPGSSPFIENSK